MKVKTRIRFKTWDLNVFHLLLLLTILESCAKQGDKSDNRQLDSGMKKLFSREELIEMDYPFGKYGKDIPL
ncbi:MAG: hypothetical protein ACOCUL_04415, partial [Bacteroidota bacterium]